MATLSGVVAAAQALGGLVLLAVVLAFAVARPAGLPEAVAAVPAAAIAVLTGLVPAPVAWRELVALAPTIGFLAAVLVLAHLADAHGVFRYAGSLAARLSRGRPGRLLATVFLTPAPTLPTAPRCRCRCRT